MFTKRQLIIAVSATILIALLSFILLPYLITQKSWGWVYDDKTGVMGDTIGGIAGPIIGFIGAALTFLAFFIQYQANQIQINALNDQREATIQSDRQNKIQQIENNFFELLKIHRENVKEMNYRRNEGRNVIVKILNEFYEVLEAVQESKIIRENKLDEQDLANISYLIMFFGIEESVQDTLENRFFQHYGNLNDKILEIIKKLRLKQSPLSQGKYYFNGHQSRLGHYFRHFFRTVNFIHEDEVLNDKEKEKYIKLLRTQLSTHEQVLFFFNSISDLGLPWELGKNVLPENKLISKYHLIRNVPLGFMYGFNPKRYYPKLELENDFEIRL
jgi:uncharacterized membrane protein